MSHTERIIALIDMDCFYCQVEERLNPELRGKPIAVVQYNEWRGGGIIAVNYLAREKGVTRQMRGDEAKEKCPDIQLPRVPQVRGKADLTKYRDAGKKVAEVLKSFTKLLERASIDEAYLDITEAVNLEMKNVLPVISLKDLSNTFVVGSETADFLSNVCQNRNTGLCEDDLKLAVGGVIVEKIRAEVLEKTGYKCSAGIAHNKTLAKLVCSLHKPDKQTILPQNAVSEMFAKLPIRKIKNLGGKFGHILSEKLKIDYIGELVKYSEKELIQTFDEKTGRWLYNISRGIDREPVQIKLISKSIGCCKRFPGRTSLCDAEKVQHWMKELSCEISDRLEEDLKENNRRARLLTVSFSQETNQTEISSSRAIPLKSYELNKISQDAIEVLRKNCQKQDGSYHITFLGLSVGNFEDIKNVRSITSYFGKVNKVKTENDDADKQDVPLSTIYNKDNCSILERIIPSTENIKDTESVKHVSESKDINFMKVIDSGIDNLHEVEYTVKKSDEATDDCANYSDSTVDLNETPDNLIFYKNVINCGESAIMDQTTNHCGPDDPNFVTPLDRTASISSIDSLENEINFNELSKSPVLGKPVAEDGFFAKYFKNSPYKRNFDTSKIFENGDTDESLEEEINETDLKISEICNECGEMVLITDLISHMDHHLALKISKERSPLKKHVGKEKKREEDKKEAQKKRKASVLKNSIKSFLTKEDDVSDELSELCSECNRKIKFSDLATHSDYHAAKRLHLELNNAGTSKNVENSKELSTPVKDNHRQGAVKNKHIRDITSFFKSSC